MVTAARTSFSMPPDHGAAVVRTILGTPDLKADWIAELDGMRSRLNGLRTALADAVAPRWSNAAAVRAQEGMFSLLPIAAADVLKLRSDHGIYMPTSGRINIAGLTFSDVDRVAQLFTSL
jgi:aromatic-amino-acid transaminase